MTTFLNKKSILSLFMAVMLTFNIFTTYAMASDTSEEHVNISSRSICSVFGNHSLQYGKWSPDSSSGHTRTVICPCGYSFSQTESHSSVYGSKTNYSESQHKYSVSCSICGYSAIKYESHSLSYGAWTMDNSSQHSRLASCSCGYNRYEYENHQLIANNKFQQKDATQHYLIHTCDCGFEIEETEDHTFIYGAWSSISDSEHIREVVCHCEYSTDEMDYHKDSDFDGYCDDCEYLLTFFSVTVPANMSLTVSKNGEVYAATNAAIINNSSHAVEITSVTVSAGDNWTLVPYDYNMANEKVDSHLIGFYLNGAKTIRIGTSESLSLPSDWTIDKGDWFALQYDAVVSATSDILQNEQVLTLVFIINWAPR